MGECIELDIGDVSYGGLGVGRWGGKVVFVPYGVTGDRIVARITQTKKQFSYAEIVNIIEPSPWRVEPRCPYFPKCGGCVLEHIGYHHQLTIKRNQVEEIFRRIGRYEEPKIEDIIPSPQPWHYRGKMEFHAVEKRGETVVGLRRLRGHEIVDVDRCLIAHESINLALLSAKREKRWGRLTLWSHDDGRGPYVTREVGNQTFMVPREAFFQANLYLTEKLVDLVLEMSDLKGEDTVLDAYCGVGLFTLFLGMRAKKVVGIEIDDNAVDAARINVSRLPPSRCDVRSGDVGRILSHLAQDFGRRVDLAVVDPPRGGLSGQARDGLIKMGVKRIVYISCNPTTMARDGFFLSQAGYRLTKLVPIDMFPQTAHIEVIGSWEKPDGG